MSGRPSITSGSGRLQPRRFPGRTLDWVAGQAGQLRQGGAGMVAQKLGTLFSMFLVIVPAMVSVIIIRLLRPFVLIRFGQLRSDRIGHYAHDTEIYLCRRDAGLYGPRKFDVFYNAPQVSNYQLKKMWRRVLPVWAGARWIDTINRLLPGWQPHVVPIAPIKAWDHHGLLATTPPHLKFTAAEEKRGEAGLRRLGLPPGARFICFHARDAAYLQKTQRDGQWSYHDYRDSSISDLLPMAAELVRRGYYAVRMGSVVNEALDPGDSRIIDYATSGLRSDLLDMYLAAKCAFFVNTTAGIYALGAVFRRPIVFVNQIPVKAMYTCGPDFIFIPKKLRLQAEGRYLTFREILGSEIGDFSRGEQYEQHGIEIVDNTPEEIAEAVIEMDERLRGVWQTTEEDEELQRRFWSIFQPDPSHRLLTRIGADFLRRHRDWL